MNAKRKLAMSGVAILVVLTLVAGATMAWFTDTEKVGGNFTAGVLDISLNADQNPESHAMEFDNMRPMTKKTFLEEAINTLKNPDTDPYEGEGYDKLHTPFYVRELAISNDGTLPVNLKLSFKDVDPKAGDVIPKIVPNGDGGIKQDGTVACDNELGKAYTAPATVDDNYYGKDNYAGTNNKFHVVLFEKVGDTWKPIKDDLDLTLDTLTDENGYVLVDDKGEQLVFPASAESHTYALGAYLDETAENEYQGKEYHVEFTVEAKQVDEGATFASSAVTE